MQDRFNNMINTKILVLVGIIIILSLISLSIALIGINSPVNNKYKTTNTSVTATTN